MTGTRLRWAVMMSALSLGCASGKAAPGADAQARDAGPSDTRVVDAPVGDTPIADVPVGDAPVPHDTATADVVDAAPRDANAPVHLGDLPADWASVCADGGCGAGSVTVASDSNGSGGQCVRFTVAFSFDFGALTPPGKALGQSTAGRSQVAFSIRTENSNLVEGNCWQSGEPYACCPWVIIGHGASLALYEPQASLLPAGTGAWQRIEVPIAGGFGWQLTGAAPTVIDWIEIHTNTWGYDPYTVWIDDLVIQ
jgi:hypothetical protein